MRAVVNDIERLLDSLESQLAGSGAQACDSRKPMAQQGIVHAINVSHGGVPKLPREWAEIRASGVDGDRQQDRLFHGGPDRAVCLYSLDLIAALRGEGHPIGPGSIGENLTIHGLDWTDIRPGARLEIGDVLLEVTRATTPCHKIAAAFLDGDFTRVSQKLYPGWSRYYARVLREGLVTTGDRVMLVPARLLF
jgi:MOSC domain-containing protein YiiM